MYGNWSGIVLPCEPVDCGTPIPIPGGVTVTVPGKTTFGENATVMCFEGYALDGSGIITCDETGEWTETSCEPIDCGILGVPDNGDMNYITGSTLYGHAVKFSCDTNFTMVGTETRICGDFGQWNGTQPKCEVTDCGALQDPSNGYVDTSSGATVYNIATYSCKEGYNLVGLTTRRCLVNGSWENTPPVCNIVGMSLPFCTFLCCLSF